jgi:hypothetical protein
MEPTTPQPMPERPAQGGEQINVPQAPQVAPQSAPVPQPASPLPEIPDVQAVQQAASSTQAQAANSNPVIADDVDVIEKEWVDKAEEVIAKTAGNPHAEEEAVEDLQIDYMKKRYNKDVKKSVD